MSGIQVRRLTAEDFDALEKAWGDLLARSAADPLFMSWPWQHTWWQVFGRERPWELVLLAAHDGGGELVGLCPLYRTTTRAFRLPIRRLEFLGNAWRDPTNLRSEYTDLIARQGLEAEVGTAFLDWIADLPGWDELVACNRRTDSPVTPDLAESLRGRGWLVREHDLGHTFCVPIEGTFEDYLAGMGPRRRLKLFNHRKRLEPYGEVVLERAGADGVDGGLDLLNRFHKKRWGREVFSDDRLAFHRRMAREAAGRGELEMEILKVGGRPISILYDYVVGKTKYGNQLGFDEDFDKRLSINTLHFGYSIESAFKASLDVYDFLRGEGRSGGSYKEGMTQPYRETGTLQAIRSPRLKLIAWRVPVSR